MTKWTIKKAIKMIQTTVNDDMFPKYSALRKRVMKFLETWEIVIIDEDNPEIKVKEKDISSNLFNLAPIKKEGNEYKLDDYQFNVIFLVLLLKYDPETKGCLKNLKDKKNLIDNKNKRIDKMYQRQKPLEDIKQEIFSLYKLMEDYSEIISEIKKIDYERLDKYESELDSIKTGKVINQYKDYIGFMSMEKEVKSYLSQVFEHVSSYTPEVAQEIIEELKEEELTIINVKKKLMEIRMSHSDQIEKENHELIKLVESLELNEQQYNE